MIKDILRGRLFGHPIHPMLVHFPTALFTAGMLFDLAGTVYGISDLFAASFYCLGTGLAAGIAAAVFGFIDYIKLGSRIRVFRKASWHGGLQFVTLSGFGILFGIRYPRYPDLVPPETGELTSGFLLLAVMVAGNYLGGDLVFRHGVGVFGEEDEKAKG